MIILFLIISLGLFIYIPLPWLYCKYIKAGLRRIAYRQNALVLTFDDGPGEILTPKILDILRQYNVKASFFILGANADKSPQLVRQIAADGHDICSHGYEHIHYWKKTPFRTIRNIQDGWQSINNALRQKKEIYPFRPPGGKLNIFAMLYLIIKNAPIIMWTEVSGDTSNLVKENKKLPIQQKPVGVYLVHDFDRNNPNAGELVADWLTAVLKNAEKANIKVISISEIIKNG